MPTLSLQFSAPGVEIQDYGVGLTGFSPYARTNEPLFKPGDLCISRTGQIWEYGKAVAAVTVTSPAVPNGIGGMAATTPPTPAACAFTPATGDIAAGSGYTAWSSFAIGEYGWVARNGTGI
jgi:hypothetical protein